MARESFGTGGGVKFYTFREEPNKYQGQNVCLGVDDELCGYYQDSKSKSFEKKGKMPATTKVTHYFSTENKESGFGISGGARLDGIIRSLFEKQEMPIGMKLWIKYLGMEDGSHSYQVDYDKEDIYIYEGGENSSTETSASPANETLTADDVPF